MRVIKFICLSLLVGAMLFANTRSSHAGPIGTYYLTDGHTDGAVDQYTLDAVRGNSFQANAAPLIGDTGPIAVFSNLSLIRTTGRSSSFQGAEYTGVPALTVVADGTVFTNGILADPSYEGFNDGTTDGTFNYTVGFVAGGVYATDTSWGGAGTLLFNTGESDDIGITYDKLNNSLWIQNSDTGQITDFSLTGTILSTFSTINDISTALAMDVDHTLWFQNFNTGFLEHYSTDGVFLGSEDFRSRGMGYASGGEIAAVSTVPEPSSIALLGLGGLSLAIGTCLRRSRRRPNA